MSANVVVLGLVLLVTIDMILDGITAGMWIAASVTGSNMNDSSSYKYGDDIDTHTSSAPATTTAPPFMSTSQWLLLLGTMAVIHHIIYGSIASQAPRGDRTYGHDRQRRMMTQGGHTIMFIYFAGFGTLAELVQVWRRQTTASLAKIKSAALLHVRWNAIPQLIMHSIALYQLLTHEPTSATSSVVWVTIVSCVWSLLSIIFSVIATYRCQHAFPSKPLSPISSSINANGTSGHDHDDD
jgi:hypothetical protein